MKAASGFRAASRTEPDPRRVLVVSQATVDGVAVCIRDLAQAAAAQGYLLTVACPPGGDLAAWARERHATWVRLDMRRSPHITDLRALLRLRSLARGHALVHLHSSKAGAVGRLALMSLGRRRPPSVFTPHGWSWLVGGRLAPVYRRFERLMMPVTTAVVAVSTEERAHGRAVLGSPATRIQVIPNGVDVTRFRPEGPRAGRTADPLVVFVGRLCHQRAPDIAVAALSLMRTPAARLRLVGAGEGRAAVVAQARALGLSDRVDLAGFHPDPAPDLRAADVVIVPSRYDGMALVLLEAMACGAAVVATRVAGSSVLSGAGVLVPAGEPAALARAVDALLADPARRRLLGHAARQRAVRQCSLDRSVGAILALWQDLGASPAASTAASAPPAGESRCLPPAQESPTVPPVPETHKRKQVR
jgi:glycosyltransferase involved in cell wall biosynthesis